MVSSPGAYPRSPRSFDFEALSQFQEFPSKKGHISTKMHLRTSQQFSHTSFPPTRKRTTVLSTRLMLQILLFVLVAGVVLYAGRVSYGTLDITRQPSLPIKPLHVTNEDGASPDLSASSLASSRQKVRNLNSKQADSNRYSNAGDSSTDAIVGRGGSASSTTVGASQRQVSDTFVIYAFSDTDPEYAANLAFFIRHGVWEGDGCEYVIVIQQSAELDESQLPKLPSNARYMHHANICYDWGTFGWVLQQVGNQVEEYKYVIFMNSSVRGPFLAATWPKGRHWSRAFTERITNDVKLVGPTISCEGTPRTYEANAAFRRNPHAQSYLLATDQTGLAIMRSNGRVFKCHDGMLDAVWDAELGSSKAILAAGFNLDCLMLRYQGVDWRDRVNWQCNGGMNPYLEYQNDGISLHPLEVMFVKIKARQLDLGWTSQLNALKLQKWMDDRALQGRPSPVGVGASGVDEEKGNLKLPRILAMAQYAGNGSCFDVPYYMRNNRDLPAVLGETKGAALDHFVNHGQWEGRPFLFHCGHMQKVAQTRERNIMPVQQEADEAAAKAATMLNAASRNTAGTLRKTARKRIAAA